MTRRAQWDEGASLVEVLVSAAVGVVVLGIAATALVSGQRASAQTVDRLHADDTARVALQTLGRELRTAVRSGSSSSAILAAGATRVVFYAHDRPVPPAPAGTGPTRVTYRVDPVARTLVEERVAAPPASWSVAEQDYSYAGRPVVRRVVARDVVTAPVFTYHAVVTPACVRATTCPVLPLVDAGSGPVLSAADLPRVRAVTVSVSVSAARTGPDATTVLRSLVTLPNREEPVRP